MALDLHHITADEFANRLRTRYKAAQGDDCARIATWILNHLEKGDFTDAQLRTAFALTAGQWTTLKTKLTALRGNWLAVKSAAGE
jgi:hypothetical protein